MSSPIYSGRNVFLLRNTGYPIRKSPGHSLSAAIRGLSQLKHVLHRLLAPRHSPCALSNLFLDPIVSSVQRTKTDETDLEAVFTKVFARLNPAKFGQSSINKIADCSTQYTDIKEQDDPKRKKTDEVLKLVR